VYARQVALALTWLEAFFGLSSGLITRVVRADVATTVPVIAFDASPAGMGALLWVLPATTALTMATLDSLPPMAFMHHAWTPYHEHLVQASIGDPGSQARWEALALLVAFRTWNPVVSASSGLPVVVGDALGMLYGAARFRSKDTQVNKIFMELALLAAPRGTTIEAMHVWSAENCLADTLSRIESEKLSLPALLARVPRTMAKDGAWLILDKK
jgi:hypothetical protein